MTMFRRVACAASALLLLAGSAVADVSLEAVDACIAEREAGGDVGACISGALSDCTAMPPNMPDAAVLCYVEAERVLADGSASLGAAIAERAGPEAAAVTRINAKYDVLSGLLQCDRLEELAVISSDLEGKDISREKKRCQTIVVGLSYARLRRLEMSVK